MVGAAILQGMLVTLRQFFGSYAPMRWVMERARIGSGDGTATIQYPDEKQQHPERFRYFPFLVYDGTPDNLRCVSCKICEQECPPQCIYIEQAKDEQNRPLRANGRPYPKTFNIDTALCMSCRICVDVCPFDAIEMDNRYELSAYDRHEPLVDTMDKLLKSADYFKQIKPSEAAVVDARLAAKAKKAAATSPVAPPAAPPPANA